MGVAGAGPGFSDTEDRPKSERVRPWRRHGSEDRAGDPRGAAGPSSLGRNRRGNRVVECP